MTSVQRMVCQDQMTDERDQYYYENIRISFVGGGHVIQCTFLGQAFGYLIRFCAYLWWA